MLQSCPALQTQGVSAEKLARDADEADATIEQRRYQVGPHTGAVLALVEGDQRREERGLEHRADRPVAQVEAAAKGKIVFADLQGVFLERSTPDLLEQGEGLATDRTAELLGTTVLARIWRQVAGGALQKQTWH